MHHFRNTLRKGSQSLEIGRVRSNSVGSIDGNLSNLGGIEVEFHLALTSDPAVDTKRNCMPISIALKQEHTARKICEIAEEKATQFIGKHSLSLYLVDGQGCKKIPDSEYPLDLYRRAIKKGEYKKTKFVLRKQTDVLRFHLISDKNTYWSLKVTESSTAKEVCQLISNRLDLFFSLIESSTGRIIGDQERLLPLYYSWKNGDNFLLRNLQNFYSESVESADQSDSLDQYFFMAKLINSPDSARKMQESQAVPSSPKPRDQDLPYIKTPVVQLRIEPKWQIRFQDLEFGKVIGGGNFGQVVSGMYNGQKVAIKKLVFLPHCEMEKYWQRELDLFQTLHHPNIVKFIGCCQNGDSLYLVTELILKGDLKNLVRDESVNLSWELRLKMAMDLASALKFFYEHNFVHRDIKSDNLLITSDLRIKLCDFGLARSVAQKRMTMCGTHTAMAPEVFRGEDYDSKVDIFSFGLVMVELITNKEPPTRNIKDLFAFPERAFRQTCPLDCPPSFIELALDCLKFKPEERPDIYEISRRLQDIAKTVADSPAVRRYA